jgi:putative aminopeptidase FrvX
VPAITVAIPCRYIHSPVSLLRQSDLTATAQLVNAGVRQLATHDLRTVE